MDDMSNIEQEISDAIMERPHGFNVADKWFYLYPVTLGKTLLLSHLIPQLNIDNSAFQRNSVIEVVKATNKNREIVNRILAIYTFRSRDEIFDVENMRLRQEFFAKHLSNEDAATLLLLMLSKDPVNTFSKYLGLDKERKELSRITKIKNEKGNSVTFCGKSLYGTLIDAACERYGWTLEYVVWGVSYANLQMMFADMINSIYLSDEERKKAHISNDRTVINADDPKNWARIRAMKWD